MESCDYDPDLGSVQVNTCVRIAPNRPWSIIDALQRGPVSIEMESDQGIIKFYDGGIIDDDNCGTTLDHAALAVGNGRDDGETYFIVKNSWATDWGEGGYFRIKLTDGPGICGINMTAY